VKWAIRGDGKRTLPFDFDIIEFDLVAHLKLQLSEIRAMPYRKVMLFHRLMCEQKAVEMENKKKEADAWRRQSTRSK